VSTLNIDRWTFENALQLSPLKPQTMVSVNFDIHDKAHKFPRVIMAK
jgi:hypothetical protein